MAAAAEGVAGPPGLHRSGGGSGNVGGGGVARHLLARGPVLALRYGAYELAASFQEGASRGGPSQDQHLRQHPTCHDHRQQYWAFADISSRAQFGADGREGSPRMAGTAFSAGLLAGAAEAAVTTPAGLLHARAQLQPAMGRPVAPQPLVSLLDMAAHLRSQATASVQPKLAGPLPVPACLNWRASTHTVPVAVQAIMEVEGLGRLFRGLPATALHDSLYAGVFFGGWAYLEQCARELRALRHNSLDTILVAPSPMEMTAEAGLAAATAATATAPLDAAVIRNHLTVVPKHIAMERRLLRLPAAGGPWWTRALRGVAESRMLPWRATALRALQHGIGTAALVGTYHLALSAFSWRRG
eukprot:SM000010S04319  [mRNA]  locus=s10:898208:899780:- [translate_table: standard]